MKNERSETNTPECCAQYGQSSRGMRQSRDAAEDSVVGRTHTSCVQWHPKLLHSFGAGLVFGRTSGHYSARPRL